METIVRGTTPSLNIDFSDVPEYPDFDINDITSVSLIIKGRNVSMELGLSDMTIDGSVMSYHFTQEQTLSFTAHETLRLDMHVVANGERMKVEGEFPQRIRVENTEKNEVM